MGLLTISDETATGRRVGTLVLAGLPDQITVRDLIRWRVREEVARFNLTDATVFSGLAQPTETEAVVNGYRLKRQRKLDWEEQADVAERSFQANGFFILVDKRQAESLDEVIALTEDLDVSFIKLVPLVGG